MKIDKLDKEYLQKLFEKAIAEHDGKIPVTQLNESDYDKWNGVNIQGHSRDEPEPEQDTMALYLIDANKRLSKRFTVTKTLLYFLARGTQMITYGTTAPDGHQVKIVLQWEKEKRA